MDIVQIVGLGIVASVLAIAIKKQTPELAVLVSAAAGVIIFFAVLPAFAGGINILTGLSRLVAVDTEFITIILKIIGIAYIADFGAQVCMDAGEASIAAKIELSGKVLIMVASAPILYGLINLIAGILP